MTMFRNILFPVDFSDQCQAMRHDVEFMTRACGAKLTLLHALTPPAGVELLGNLPPTPEHRQDASSRLHAFSASMDSSLDVQTVVVDGDPAGNIAQFVEKHSVDLVMMPTRGFGAFRRFLIGSVTSKVLHDLRCPVWTSAHVEKPHGRIPPAIRAILCAIDVTPQNEELIRRAHELAVFFSARLHLFHAINAAPLSTEGFSEIDFRHFLLQSSREAIARLQQRSGTNYPIDIYENGLTQGLATSTHQLNADLVVIGRGHISERFGLFRTNAHAIIRASSCPVLSFCC